MCWLPVSRQLRSRVRRSATAILLIAGYLAGTIGFPLPARVSKDKSQPFPCQDHACGCQNAEECWRHCCCFTNEEKLAWARDHNVRPPEYVASTSPLGWGSARIRDSGDAKPTGCTCGDKGCRPHHPNIAQSKATPQSHTKWVLGWAAQKCQGNGPWGMPTFVALRPPARVTCTFLDEPVGYCSTPAPLWSSSTSAPTEPPPRPLA